MVVNILSKIVLPSPNSLGFMAFISPLQSRPQFIRNLYKLLQYIDALSSKKSVLFSFPFKIANRANISLGPITSDFDDKKYSSILTEIYIVFNK